MIWEAALRGLHHDVVIRRDVRVIGLPRFRHPGQFGVQCLAQGTMAPQLCPEGELSPLQLPLHTVLDLTLNSVTHSEP